MQWVKVVSSRNKREFLGNVYWMHCLSLSDYQGSNLDVYLGVELRWLFVLRFLISICIVFSGLSRLVVLVFHKLIAFSIWNYLYWVQLLYGSHLFTALRLASVHWWKLWLLWR